MVDGVDENNNLLQNVPVFCKRLLFLSTPSAAHKQVEKTLLSGCCRTIRIKASESIGDALGDNLVNMYFTIDPNLFRGSVEYTSQDGTVRLVYRKNNRKWLLANTGDLYG